MRIKAKRETHQLEYHILKKIGAIKCVKRTRYWMQLSFAWFQNMIYVHQPCCNIGCVLYCHHMFMIIVPKIGWNITCTDMENIKGEISKCIYRVFVVVLKLSFPQALYTCIYTCTVCIKKNGSQKIIFINMKFVQNVCVFDTISSGINALSVAF